MKKNWLDLYRYSDTEDIYKGIFNYQDKNVEKILIFLDKFISEKISNNIIFNYCNEIYIKNTEKKIALGKLLKIDQENKLIIVINHKEYIPYYSETEVIESYKFENINFIDFIDLLIIKFIKYTHSEKKKLDGVYNFPKYVIMKSKENVDKEKICKQLDIDKTYFTYDKYKKIIEKYKILLIEFYKTLLSSNYFM